MITKCNAQKTWDRNPSNRSTKKKKILIKSNEQVQKVVNHKSNDS